MDSCSRVIVLGVWLTLVGRVAAAAEPSLAEYYGFLPLEVFKLDQRSANLLAGDFNHDGRTDLAAINNTHHRIDLLLQRDQPSAAAATTGPKDVNRVEDIWRFELKKVPVDHEVPAFAIADFNNDGRTDIAYIGVPDQLVIRFQPEKGEWTAKQQLRVPDVAAGSWCIAAGDLNHDHKDDLVILGKSETYVLLQPNDGKFGTMTRLMNTSDKLGLAQIADLNGDGLSDLCYLAGEGSARGLGVRLQDVTGLLGPEYLFDLEKPRSVSVRDVDGKPGQEILTIDSRTGRLKVLRLTTKSYAPSEVRERLVRYGFGKAESGPDRDFTIADLDGDGLQDVAVSDSSGSRVFLFRQAMGRGLDLGAPFPSVGGVDGLRAGSVRTLGRTELVLHSASEKSLGVSRWDQGRLSFPESLPLDQEPLGLDLVDVDNDGRTEIVFLLRTKDGRDTVYTLGCFRRNAEDTAWEPHPGMMTDGKGPTVNIKTVPERFLVCQITGDERPELLFLQGNKPPVVMQLTKDNRFQELPTTGTISGGTVAGRSAFPTRMGGHPGLLISQENYARHLQLGPQNRWQIGEQINANENAAKIAGAALIDLDGEGELEAALVDTGVKKLRLLRRQNAIYQPWKEIDLGEMNFLSSTVADLNGDQRPDLVLFGSDQMAVLYAGGTAPALEELATFETQLDKAFPADVVAGDLNGDGVIDLAMTDTRSHSIEILRYAGPGALDHALYFRVFEEKTFQNDDAPGIEPREALIVDVTGDGRPDLVLLAHDRLLVYPQDAGTVK